MHVGEQVKCTDYTHTHTFTMADKYIYDKYQNLVKKKIGYKTLKLVFTFTFNEKTTFRNKFKEPRFFIYIRMTVFFFFFYNYTFIDQSTTQKTCFIFNSFSSK